MDEFQFPPIHATREFTGEDGERYAEAVSPPVCDFCMDMRVKWDYDCARFVLPDGFASVGMFATCERCSDLVEAQDWDGLVTRVVASWTALGLSAPRFGAQGVIDGFAEHYTPGRKAFG